MLRRLQAEETRALINALLAAGGRSLPDDERRSYSRQLERDEAGVGAVPQRAPAITPQMAKRLGVRLHPPEEAST